MKLPALNILIFGIILIVVGLIQISTPVAFPMWLILLCVGINYIVDR
jgi:hypothetical protein